MTKLKHPTQESFLNDVKYHQMEIIKDDGLYRHIRFKKPGETNLYFDIISWPEYLSIAGDTGDYTFKRIPEMFNFFVSEYSLDQFKLSGNVLINSGYWLEKLVSTSVYGGDAQVDHEALKDLLLSEIDNYFLNGHDRQEVADEIQALIDECSNYDDRYSIYEALHSFDSAHIQLDICEYKFMRASYHKLWCLYAIAWGILQYKIHKTQNSKPSRLQYC